MKRNLILLAICAAIAAVYFLDTKHQEEKQKQEDLEKQILTLTKDAVGEISLVKEDNTFTAKVDGVNWQLIEPLQALGDRNAWDSIRTNLTTGERERVVLENAEDLAPYGLDAPKIAVTIKAATEEASTTILLGNETPTSGKYYALIKGTSDVLTVNSAVFNSVDKELFDLRDKTVLRVESDQVQKVKIAHADFETTLERRGEDDWVISEPMNARADKTKVRDLINAVRNSKVQHFIEETPDMYEPYGLVKPATSITFWSGDADDSAGLAAQAILLGGTSPATEMLYAKRDGQKNVFTVKPQDFSKVPTSLDDLRKTKLFDIRSWEVERFVVASAGAEIINASKSAGDWFITKPEDGKADYTSVSDVLRKITDLDIGEFLSGGKDENGVADEAIRLELWKKAETATPPKTKEGEEAPAPEINFETASISLSGPVEREGASFYVGALDDPLEAFAIPAETIDGIIASSSAVKLDAPEPIVEENAEPSSEE